MRSHHLVVPLGIVVVVNVISGCGRGNADRAADTALTSVGTSIESSPGPPAAAAGDSAAAISPPSSKERVSPAPPSGSPGRVIDVQMLGDAGGYRFAPTTVTVKRGDRVRWTMVSGAPHNVAFWPDSIPAGAAARIAANMPKTMGPLTGPLLMTTNETYEVSFEGLPAGTYRYFCTPHLALGMKAIVQVE